MKSLRKIGILTGGGDCPGLNAVIRGIAKPALENGIQVYGIEDGFEGLVEGKAKEIYPHNVSGIISLGGTILGSSNKGDPFHWPVKVGDKIEIQDKSHDAVNNYKLWGLDALIAIGGDGTMNIAHKLSQMGVNIVGVPKTIDNDLEATDQTFGHDTAVSIVTEAIDRLHTTASSHHRVMVVETMGRYAGWIALNGGVAGGADIILIHEIPFEWDVVYERVLARSKKGKRFSIVCVSEGAKPKDGDMVVKAKDIKRTDPIQLGGVAEVIAKNIEDNTGLETRVTVLGHIQRGGSPTAYDRILSTMYGTKAFELVMKGKFNHMAALKGGKITSVKIVDAISKQKLVTPNTQQLIAAHMVGVSFGTKEL